MKRLLKKVMALCLAACAITPLSAKSHTETQLDSLIANHKLIFFGDGENPHADSVRSLITNFYYDQFRHFQDPAAPYFLFMSKNSDLAMGIGGVVRMRGWCDWGGSVNSSAFAP